MPNFGPTELIVMLLMGAVIVGVVVLALKLIGRVNSGQRKRIDTLERRIRDLEGRQ
ncbi:hypothetical protein [Deinococcus aquatilis]|jgi:Tfp pilus assembly protein PilN|uniref:hypothetical protein n=1 Tax=Deinococcus aquatilis TaxID=519440 RepID=UPI00035D832F|nr:hypothetical protein [Deinococcus aquatilis]